MDEEREDISGNVAPREVTRGGKTREELRLTVDYLPNQARELLSAVSAIRIILPTSVGEPKTNLIIAGDGLLRADVYLVKLPNDLWVLYSICPTAQSSLLVPIQEPFQNWLDNLPSMDLNPFSRLKPGESISYRVNLFDQAFKKNKIQVIAERGKNLFDHTLTMMYNPRKGKHDIFAQLTKKDRGSWVMEGLEHKLHLQK